MVDGHGYDPERDKWSIAATERLFPSIAKQAFQARHIVYAWQSGIDRLDTQYGVDALLTTPRRNVAVAIRLRGHSYYTQYGDVTIRYESLQTLGKILEMQKSIARFMFYAWCDTDRPSVATNLVDWHIIHLQLLVDQFLKGTIPYTGPISNKDSSSTFVAFNVAILKDRKLLLRSAPPMEVSAAVGGEEPF